MRNGTVYINDDVWCIAAGILTKVLGASAATDLENNLVNDWFAVGISDGDEVVDPDIHLVIWDSTESTTGLQPTLQIWWNSTHYLENLADEFAIEDSFAVPTFARTETISAFAGIIGSRNAPFNVFDDVAPFEVCDNTEQPSGTGSQLSFGWFETSFNADCFKGLILWDIDLIPDGAIILNVSMQLKGMSVTEGIQLQNNQCEFNHIATFPALLGSDAKGVDASDGENYLTDPNCSTKLGILVQGGSSVDTPEPAVIFDLGNATGEVQDRLGKGSSTSCSACTGFDWFAVGLDFDQGSKNGTNREIQIVRGDTGNTAKLIIRFQTPTDGIIDLTAIGRFVDVDLDWTTPTTYGYTNITGYQINFTSPQGNPPLTVIVNDTGSTTTDALVTGLNSAQNYTFRVQAWDDEPLIAELSNEVNVTTQSLGNFTIGTVGDTPQFTLNDTQADARDIKYVRTDVTDTQTVIDVIHPNSFTLQCDMYFKLALSNQTFTGLTTVPEGATEQKATFTFNNQQNDIIEITCFDTATNVSADYLVTQSVASSFLLLDQFKMFRDGTYGTAGQFGSIDLITLGAVIVAMIGFNRVNETVGAIFLVVILGMLSFFEIVVWQTFMFGTVAAVLMLVVASTRKR